MEVFVCILLQILERTARNRLTIIIFVEDRGGTVVKVLCYKSEGRWFDPSWYQWIFSLT